MEQEIEEILTHLPSLKYILFFWGMTAALLIFFSIVMYFVILKHLLTKNSFEDRKFWTYSISFVVCLALGFTLLSTYYHKKRVSTYGTIMESVDKKKDTLLPASQYLKGDGE